TEGEHQVAAIEGAVLIPLHELPRRSAELLELGWALDAPVAVLCHHGVRSRSGAAILQGAGFTSVRSVAGGIEAWSVRVDPSVPRY
ncbi:MAG: rhodanese-like domain-containing protein, partial [Polyangiales bacterium]